MSERNHFSNQKLPFKIQSSLRCIQAEEGVCWNQKSIWVVDLAYVDKLSKDKNSVKFSLVRHDLFDGTVDAERMEEWEPRTRKKQLEPYQL